MYYYSVFQNYEYMIRSHESGSIKAELVCIGTGAKMNKLL